MKNNGSILAGKLHADDHGPAAMLLFDVLSLDVWCVWWWWLPCGVMNILLPYHHPPNYGGRNSKLSSFTSRLEIICFSCSRNKYKLANSGLFRTSLVDFVGADADDLIRVWCRSSRKKAQNFSGWRARYSSRVRTDTSPYVT
jgi:hypothetical protein